MTEQLMRVITCKCGAEDYDTDTDLHEWHCFVKGCGRIGQCTESWACPHCTEEVELPVAKITVVGGEDD